MELAGRTDGNIKVVIPIMEIPCKVTSGDHHTHKVKMQPGDYVHVKVSILLI